MGAGHLDIVESQTCGPVSHTKLVDHGHHHDYIGEGYVKSLVYGDPVKAVLLMIPPYAMSCDPQESNVLFIE